MGDSLHQRMPVYTLILHTVLRPNGDVGNAGRDRSVGIATRYCLDGPGIEYRWGVKFSLLVQTGPGVHLASCTIGTGAFPGVKRPGRGFDHPPLFSPEVKKRV
jgi:hypothetical protein